MERSPHKSQDPNEQIMNPLNNILQVPQKLHPPDEYPANWKQIAIAVKKEADWCCERCGAPDDEVNGYMLTVHHKNGIKSDCRRENLVALCQKCHLVEQGKLRRQQKLQALQKAGQLSFWSA